MRGLFRNQRVNSMILIASLRVVSLVTNLGTGMITAWSLGPAGRGTQAAILLGALTLSGICSFGLHTALVYNMKSDPPNKSYYFGSALLIGLIVSLIGVTIGWFALPWILDKFDEHTLLAGRLLTFVVPVSVISYVLNGVLDGHHEFNFVSRLGLLNNFFILCSLSLLWLSGLLTPATAAMSYLLPTVPITAMLAWRATSILRPATPFHGACLKRMFTYSVRFFGVDLICTVSGYLDQFLMVLFLNAQDLGLYSVATTAERVLGIIPASILTVTFPSVAGRSKDDIREIVGITARLTSIVTTSAAVFLGIFAPYFLLLLYGPKFAEAIVPFRILLLSALVSNAVGTFYQMYSGSGRPEIVTVFEAIGFVIAATSMVILIPFYGINGVAIAAVLSAAGRLILVLGGLPAVLHLSIPRLIINWADIKRVFHP